MKKRLFALLMAFVMMASTVVFANDTEMPDEERNPNIGVPDRPLVSASAVVEETPPYDPTAELTAEQIEAKILKEYQAAVANTRYNLAWFSGESFETTGKIPELSEPVPLYEAKFPVKVVDQNGQPVHNALVMRAQSSMTAENSVDVTFRDRPALTADAIFNITNTKGEVDISYYGRFKETTLFVFTPDAVDEYYGKYLGMTYPEHTRFDITIPTEENPEPLILQVNIPETEIEAAPQIPSVKVKIWHNSERGAGYLCKLAQDVYGEVAAEAAKRGEDAVYPQMGLFPPFPAAVTADENGLATLPQVEPGMYLLDVFVPGEERAIKRIHLTVTEGKTSTRILFLKDEK